VIDPERSSYSPRRDGRFGFPANVFANGDHVLRQFETVYGCPLQSCGLVIPRGKQSIPGSVSTPLSWVFGDSNTR